MDLPDVELALAAFFASFAVVMVAQASVKVVFAFSVASLVAAVLAIAWYAAILVSLFLAFSANLVVFAASATTLESSVMLSQVFWTLSEAAMTAQVDTRVVFACMVARSVAAVEALASNAAILVALFLSLASSFVVFAARETVASREAICLQRDLSLTVLVVVLLPLAATAEVRRRVTKKLVNCMLAV